MNIQPFNLSNYQNNLNKKNNTNFKAIVPHGFPKYSTSKETLQFFSSPDLHKLVKGLSDKGKDLHVFYEPENLGFGPNGSQKIPEMYDLYVSKSGKQECNIWLGKIESNGCASPNIAADKLYKDAIGENKHLENVKTKGLVEYIADGLNRDLKK